jgi:hypothetical protein
MHAEGPHACRGARVYFTRLLTSAKAETAPEQLSRPSISVSMADSRRDAASELPASPLFAALLPAGPQDTSTLSMPLVTCSAS